MFVSYLTKPRRLLHTAFSPPPNQADQVTPAPHLSISNLAQLKNHPPPLLLNSHPLLASPSTLPEEDPQMPPALRQQRNTPPLPSSHMVVHPFRRRCSLDTQGGHRKILRSWLPPMMLLLLAANKNTTSIQTTSLALRLPLSLPLPPPL